MRHPNTFWTIKPSPNILLRLRQFNQFPLLCGQGWERLKIDRSTIVFFNQKINILINIFSRDLFKRQRDLFLCRWSIWETRTSWVWGLRNLLWSFRQGMMELALLENGVNLAGACYLEQRALWRIWFNSFSPNQRYNTRFEFLIFVKNNSVNMNKTTL